MKLLTSLLIVLLPVVILMICCLFIGASIEYYLIAWCAGSGFGVLALMTVLTIKNVKS